MKRIYNKLVRDKIPEIIEKNGEKAITKILDNNDYWSSLLEKVKEELYEIETAETLDETKKELADLIEVVRAMAENKGFTLPEIIDEADKKAAERGGFYGRILLLEVRE